MTRDFYFGVLVKLVKPVFIYYSIPPQFAFFCVHVLLLLLLPPSFGKFFCPCSRDLVYPIFYVHNTDLAHTHNKKKGKKEKNPRPPFWGAKWLASLSVPFRTGVNERETEESEGWGEFNWRWGVRRGDRRRRRRRHTGSPDSRNCQRSFSVLID